MTEHGPNPGFGQPRVRSTLGSRHDRTPGSATPSMTEHGPNPGFGQPRVRSTLGSQHDRTPGSATPGSATPGSVNPGFAALPNPGFGQPRVRSTLGSVNPGFGYPGWLVLAGTSRYAAFLGGVGPTCGTLDTRTPLNPSTRTPRTSSIQTPIAARSVMPRLKVRPEILANLGTSRYPFQSSNLAAHEQRGNGAPFEVRGWVEGAPSLPQETSGAVALADGEERRLADGARFERMGAAGAKRATWGQHRGRRDAAGDGG